MTGGCVEPPPAATSSQAGDRLEGLGRRRDGLLVVGGALYVLGYVVWSLHALRQHLGLLPALELHYLLAGSLVALIILAALLLGVLGMRFAYASEAWKGSTHRSVRVIGSALPWAIGLVTGAVAYVLLWAAGHPLLWYAVYAVLMVTLFLARKLRIMSERTIAAALIGAFMAIAGSVFFVTIVYPEVPQELGGVKPRCGYVEIAADDVSADLEKELFVGSKGSGVARSKKLSIFFSGGDAYVVRLRDGSDGETYELRKDVVKSARGC